MIYKSTRVGKDGRLFHLLKFRTMRVDGGTPTAAMDDDRLTPVGKWLRRFKLDELPTLINVIKGDVSLVGPRPDVPSEIVSLDPLTKEKVLSVKPGLLSPATLWNIDEDAFLAGEDDPHAVYTELIKPLKYKLNVWYVNQKSFLFDLKIIIATALRMAHLPYRWLGVLPYWAHRPCKDYMRD